MWVFGYGSLMWDGWEADRDCIRRVMADLPDYCRSFNKASVKNWGTKGAPGPTLNLLKVANNVCQGIAFEFPDSRKAEILSYLEGREGKAFSLQELLIRIEGKFEVLAIVPLYRGKNVITGKALEEVAEMVLVASGASGECLAYVNDVFEKLSALGVSDPAVNELYEAVNRAADDVNGLK